MDPCLDSLVTINREDCIGDSRTVINNNFQALQDYACTLENSVNDIKDKFRFLVPLYGIINFWSDVTLGGLNFDLSGKGKVDITTGRDLTGFALCNGNNGTPDLRDRFVIAAGGSYVQGELGPVFNTSASLSLSSVQLTIPELPKHRHQINDPGHNHTIGDPGHQHTYYDKYHKNCVSAVLTTKLPGALIAYITGSTEVASCEDKDHLSITDKALTNVKVIKNKTGITQTELEGGDQPHENRPPYFALAYIMRYI